MSEEELSGRGNLSRGNMYPAGMSRSREKSSDAIRERHALTPHSLQQQQHQALERSGRRSASDGHPALFASMIALCDRTTNVTHTYTQREREKC